MDCVSRNNEAQTVFETAAIALRFYLGGHPLHQGFGMAVRSHGDVCAWLLPRQTLTENLSQIILIKCIEDKL
ncbi:hypothetical protein [Maribacter sp. ACAM166]|uniref:hypothetical protein n=1 Tax=Maribacter sp. ACAM166 TaxID=2508996 RepID=UPI0010FD0144|nr:hypothetical protein [Maribacter sp. ACAM166]TLP81847.1 hypothetical protein ES765_03975 [Maribacter sp. ACAM166]